MEAHAGGEDRTCWPLVGQSEAPVEPLPVVIPEVVECCSHQVNCSISKVKVEPCSHSGEVVPQARLWASGIGTDGHSVLWRGTSGQERALSPEQPGE